MAQHHGDDYWRAAAERGRGWLGSEDIVSEALTADGWWETEFEWRISTVTMVRIEAIARDERRWYHVTVSTDQESQCWSPTVSRALEYAGAFVSMHQDTFWALGWPSWGSRTER